MIVPNLPTDNLYKFAFIGGLTLVLTIAILVVTQYFELMRKMDLTDITITQLETDISFLKEDKKFIRNEVDKLEHEVDSIEKTSGPLKKSYNLRLNEIHSKLLSSKDYREYFVLVSTYQSELSPLSYKVETLRKLHEENKKLTRKILAKSSILTTKVDALSRETDFKLLLSFFAFAGLFCGTILAKYGYKNWKELVQNPTDQKLRVELEMLIESAKKVGTTKTRKSS